MTVILVNLLRITTREKHNFLVIYGCVLNIKSYVTIHVVSYTNSKQQDLASIATLSLCSRSFFTLLETISNKLRTKGNIFAYLTCYKS